MIQKKWTGQKAEKFSSVECLCKHEAELNNIKMSLWLWSIKYEMSRCNLFLSFPSFSPARISLSSMAPTCLSSLSCPCGWTWDVSDGHNPHGFIKNLVGFQTEEQKQTGTFPWFQTSHTILLRGPISASSAVLSTLIITARYKIDLQLSRFSRETKGGCMFFQKLFSKGILYPCVSHLNNNEDCSADFFIFPPCFSRFPFIFVLFSPTTAGRQHWGCFKGSTGRSGWDIFGLLKAS